MNAHLRILMLEDNPVDAELIERTLRKGELAFESLRVDTEAGFRDALSSFHPGLILADYHLPEFDGAKALTIAHAQEPDLPFIFVSGAMGEETAVEMMHLGADDYILKDRLPRLPMAIRRSIAHRKQTKAYHDAATYAATITQILLTSSQPFCQCFPDGKLGICNQAFCALLGYSEQELAQLNWFADLTPAQWQKTERIQLDKLCHTERPVVYEQEFIRKDGTPIPVEMRVHRVRKPSGDTDYYYAFINDIAQRRQTMAALELQARRAEALLELPRAADRMNEIEFMQYGLAFAEQLTDSQIAFVHFIDEDQETIELVTWSRSTLAHYCTAAFDDHYPISQAGIWADSVRQRKPVLFNDYAGVSHAHGLPEGHAPLTRLISVPVMDSGLVRMMAGVGNRASPYRDVDVETVLLIANEIWRIVRQRRADKALRESEKNYRVLAEQVPAIIYRSGLSETNPTTYISAAIAKLGYTPEEWIAHPGLWNSALHPQDRDQILRVLADIQNNGDAFSGEYRLRTKDGNWRYVRDEGQIIRDKVGRPLSLQGVMVDITQQKLIEDELTLHRQHLEKLVALRTAELDAARKEAERLTRVKSEFLANMSHEIRTPLNAVLGFAQVGQRDSQGRKIRETFARIVDSGQLLLGVVNDILDFSKLEAGKLLIEHGTIDLREVVQRCVDLVRNKASDKGLTFEVDTAPDLPARCRGDGLRLTQVVSNLLSNAVKFTQRGGVTLSIERGKDTLLCRVTDTGIGMSAEQVSRLFTPFEQADSSTTREYGGTGLGLTITHRFLGLMGGTIRVNSRPRIGSTFEIRIPLVEPEGRLIQGLSPPSADHRPGRSGGHLQGLSILVAEDNEVNRLVLQDLLDGEGCRLEQVENGLLAVERVRNGIGTPYDLVLMDVQMPVMDGYDATRRLHEIMPELPIIGLTAHTMMEERERCLAAGMVEHVAKPIELDILLAAILRHTRPRDPAAPVTGTAAAALATAPQPYHASMDWPDIESYYAGRRAFLLKLLATAAQSQANCPQQLHQAAEIGDHDQIHAIAHGLKGIGGHLLPRSLHALATLTDDSARQHQPASRDHARRLAADIATWLGEITSYVQFAADATEDTQSDVVQDNLAEVIGKLEMLLAADDTDAASAFTHSRRLLRQAFGDGVDQLGRQIDQFDFAAALQTLRGLQDTPPL